MKTLSVKLTEEMQNSLEYITEYYSKINNGLKFTKSEIIRILILSKYIEVSGKKIFLGQDNGL